jgi:DNA-binding MarR family transcriptional regulator
MLGVLLRQPLQALAVEVNSLMVADGYADLRPAHSAVFMGLGTEEAARISELAERAGMTKQSMGALVGYLEQRGYVSVTPDPQDGRAKIVRRSKKARDSEGHARRNVARVQERWRRMLDPGEFDELVRLLRRLNDRLMDERESNPRDGRGETYLRARPRSGRKPG